MTVFVSSLSSERYVKHITLKLIYNDSELQAIDDFCVLADNDRDLPPLRRGKKWADYRLSGLEWQIIELARDCLKVSALSSHIFPAEFSYQIVADTHGELSAHKTSTIHMVFPLIEKVQSDWENHCLNPVYAPVKHALEAGLKNMSKWYRKADDTLIYFISHGMYTCFWLKNMIYVWQLVLDPTRKLSYLDAAWEPEWVEAGKNRMKEIVSCLLFFFGWFRY